jgi:hypothetical protein
MVSGQAFCDDMAVFDPAVLSGQDCAAAVVLLARVEKMAAAGKARAALRAAECGAHGGKGLSDAPDWLARHSGGPAGRARDELSAAAAVEDSPETKEALLNGELSLAQAAEITDTDREQPGSAAELIELAKKESFAVVRERARTIRLEAMDREALHAHQRASRYHRQWIDGMGMLRYSGALPPDVGVPIAKRIDTETDRIFRTAHKEGRREPREAYAADALVAMLQGVPSKGKPGSADVVFVVDLNAYRSGEVADGEVCHILGGGPIPVRIVREMAKDAFLKVVLHDGVNIHTVKHFGRHINAVLRTALDLGAPPGFLGLVCKRCGNRYRIEIDHDNPVGNRGETSHANTDGLCHACHLIKTGEDRAAGLLNNNPRPAGNTKRPTGKDPPGS